MDGVRLHPHQALAMTREQALETLLVVGSEDDKRYAALMLAGPVLSEDDIERLAQARPQRKNIVRYVKLAIAEQLICAA